MRAHRFSIVLVLFAVSGLSGLIYESIWTHYLKLFLGHAAHAQTLVLAIFMGGMALGSALASRWAGRWRDPMVAYASIEALIGVIALAFHPLFVTTTDVLLGRVLPRVPAGVAVDAVKWTAAAALILPQCVLLGMTFPLMTGGVLRRFGARPGRSIALLYFTNSLGAAAGVLLSGFVLVPAAGLPGTIAIAGFLNLAVAVSVWFVARLDPTVAPVAAPEAATSGRDHALPALLAVAALTGATSFMYEIGWIRMLSLVLGTSTHAFELMLSAFILGLALGGLWIQRRIDGAASPVRLLGWVQVAMGLSALATLPVYGLTFPLMRWIVESAPRTDGGYALFNLSSNGIALLVMLPATVCAGMTLPLVTYVLLARGHGERAVGAVYASNTAGAIAGVVFAIQVGMPVLGLKGLVTLGAALDAALGLALLVPAARAVPRRFAAAAGACVLAVAATLLFVHLDPYRMASGVYRLGRIIDPSQTRVLYHRDGKTATASVIAEVDGRVLIKTNGKADAAINMAPGGEAEPDEATMVLLGALPHAVRPGARTAACIGFGSGLTTHVLLGSPSLESLDTIEIEPRMIEAARFFLPRVARAFDDPRSQLHVDDAKTFFSSRQRTYDIIVSEPSNPWVSGVGGLFSEEFYRHVRRHLAPGGVLVQWIQLYEIDPGLVASILKALDGSFADWTAFAPSDFDLVVLASADGAVAPLAPGIFGVPELAAELRRVRILGPQDLELRRVGDRRSWARLLRSYPTPPNSDYHPVLAEAAPRARFLQATAVALVQAARFPLPALEVLSGAVPGWSETRVTPSPHFTPSRRADAATVLQHALRDGALGRGAWRLPEDLLASSQELLGWATRCGPLPGQSAQDVALAMFPALTSAEATLAWRTIVESPCAMALAPHDRLWLELLRAVAAREGGAAHAAASVLLGDPGRLSPPQARYALAAGMLGALGEGDREAAHRLWERHAAVGEGDDLLLRWLVAESAARDGVAGARRPLSPRGPPRAERRGVAGARGRARRAPRGAC
ncbi:spermidine synthase [Anaeromyxobacter sp. Fw109-5]|uniref:spermine/spermidine synthase domain-containing protein n=1 Tax=Anaeromyxobacter sp. (strain Fw109-5) TaxID=404589 RepID=UPI0002F7641E|nr:spermidine synthase [Anaeromyxobacter sp. Fw109-5]